MEAKSISSLSEESEFMRDNEFIVTGYRVNFNSTKRILMSLFMLHNESVNVWTHLLGVVLFSVLFWYSVLVLGYTQPLFENWGQDFQEEVQHFRMTSPKHDTEPDIEPNSAWLAQICGDILSANLSETLERQTILCSQFKMNLFPRQSIDIWPVIIFILSAIFCLSCSSIYHLFNSHSKSINRIMSRLDYSGTSILIAGSFFPIIYYPFYCRPFLIHLYLTAITVLCCIVFTVAMLPFFQSSQFRWLRGVVFLALGLVGFVPMTHLFFLPEFYDFSIPMLYIGFMAASYIIGVLIYISRIPERFSPGKYDLCGSSHNIWHCFVLTAIIIHFIGSLEALDIREVTFCQAEI